MPGPQLADPSDDAAWRRNELVSEVLVERNRIDSSPQRRVLEQRLQLRREHEPIAIDRVMQRLDAHAVTREEYLTSALVKHRARELPVQSLDHLLAPLLVAVHEHLGVGLGREEVARRGQLLPQLEVVVDLAVLHHPDRRILVVHRLVAAREVDDREPAHAQRHAAGLYHSLVVRSAVDHRATHPPDELTAACRVPARDAADPAHLTGTHDCRTGRRSGQATVRSPRRRKGSHLVRTEGLPFVAGCLW